MYASRWIHGNNCGRSVDFLFTVYKNEGWLIRLFKGNYETQKAKCIAKCRELMKEEEKPRVRRL